MQHQHPTRAQSPIYSQSTQFAEDGGPRARAPAPAWEAQVEFQAPSPGLTGAAIWGVSQQTKISLSVSNSTF